MDLLEKKNDELREISKASLKKITQWKQQAEQILRDNNIQIPGESD